MASVTKEGEEEHGLGGGAGERVLSPRLRRAIQALREFGLSGDLGKLDEAESLIRSDKAAILGNVDQGRPTRTKKGNR